MRIVFLQDHLRSGGTENQTIHIADGLAGKGIETTVIAFRKGGALDAFAASKRFNLMFLKQGFLKADWFAPGLKRLLSKLDPDVVFAMGRMANCQAGLLAGSDRSYKLVSTFRTGRSIPYLYRKGILQSDHLVANSQEAVDRLDAQHKISRPETTSVIYNGCIRDFDTNIPPLDPKHSRDTIRLASISMFRPQKRQIDLLRICAKFRNSLSWNLTLAGDGSEKAACEEEARLLGIKAQVEFPGLLKDPRALYYDSDIAVHTSKQESLPNFLVEAQMAGLPVIAYDAGGVSETFVDQKSGFLIPLGNEAAFLEKLNLLVESPDLRLQMSEAARDYGRSQFTPEAQLRSYISLIKKTIGGWTEVRPPNRAKL